MMNTRLALAHMVESRSDFYSLREPLVREEIQSLGWLRDLYSPIESGEISSDRLVADFSRFLQEENPDALIVHLPIWSDPVFTLKLASSNSLPVLLLGNSRPDTSSLVGILGAGGALDQIGRDHVRVFDHRDGQGRQLVTNFVQAAAALRRLRGQTLGLFGGRSLGIFTTVADPAQWQRMFGVDIVQIDQTEIKECAESLPEGEVGRHLNWLQSKIGGVTYGGLFTPEKLDRQVRSYLATVHLTEEFGLDFIGVKCQPEMSDGYVSQCVSHMLMNGIEDADGRKAPTVHACESDADGALTMQILKLISGGKPTALLDVRWFDAQNSRWILANCGAVAASFMSSPEDPSGFSHIQAQPHVFGAGGGGAFSAVMREQPVTLARLCRKNGEYWMAILEGEIQAQEPEDNQKVTPAFPRAVVKTSAGADFLNVFGSNHIHLVSGKHAEQLAIFCRLAGVRCQIWN